MSCVRRDDPEKYASAERRMKLEIRRRLANTSKKIFTTKDRQRPTHSKQQEKLPFLIPVEGGLR
jgi:hypothetical protein